VTKISEREKFVILSFEKPSFVVRLYEYLLEVDLKDGIRKELEDFLEAKQSLKESLGFIFQTVVPLDVWLRDIESVSIDKKGRTKIVIPHQRDITIPLSLDESKKLVNKLKELIPIAKEMEFEERDIKRKLHAESVDSLPESSSDKYSIG
jgi:hypothetical protein